MTERWDVLGLGVVAVDELLTVERHPPPNSKVEVLAEERQGGGLTGTALVAAARLGAAAAYAGVLGDDDLSRYSLQELEREGVDCSPVLRQAGAGPVHSRILVERSTGQRCILYSRAGWTPRPVEAITPDLIGCCRVLFLDPTDPEGGLRACELARERGIPVVGDAEKEPTPAVRALLARIDHLIIAEALAERLTGARDPAEMVRALADSRYACLGVTAGERGCWFAERGGPVQHQPAYRVAVVDTTGCGDVFHGAYAAALARKEPVASAMRMAAGAAALKATQPGGRRGIPDWPTLQRFLAKAEPLSTR